MNFHTLTSSPDEPILMGIINLTPDSFSDGGSYTTTESALAQATTLLGQGAHILDLGAESTRPGHQQISTDEEIDRLLPPLHAIREKFPETYISIDCYRSETARAALKAGAHMINDIWGLLYDPEMAPLIAEYDADVCIMHNRKNTEYINYLEDVLVDLKTQISIAKEAGIADEKICIDPGIGFGKNYEQNLALLSRLDILQVFPYPILLGTSRKGFLGRLLDVPPKDRDLATAVTSALGYEKGARIFRVHHVAASKEALTIAKAIKGASHGADSH